MGIEENNIVKRAMIRLSQFGAVVFRQNVGVAWVGEEKRIGKNMLLLTNPRRIRMGLIKGSSDLVGWYSVEVTPEMVGHKIAVILCPEGKTDDGQESKEQKVFSDNVTKAGGIAGVFRDEDEAVNLIIAWRNKFLP